VVVDNDDAARAAAIRQRVRDKEGALIELTRALLAFRSENPKLLRVPGEQEKAREQEEACQAYVAAQLQELGLDVDRWEILPDRYDVVGTLHGAGEGRSLILNGHMDVVPAGDPAMWPHDPWAGEVSDGKLWGRGSCDMKGGMACAIIALHVLRDLGIRLNGSVIVESVVDEETGGPGTRSCIERGYGADGAIALESTSLDILPVEGGLEWLRVVVRGVGGHSAMRFKSVHAGGQGTAVSAIEKMAKILAMVQELERYWGNTKVHPLMPKGITTINPGVIMGGSGGGTDGVPRNLNAYSNFADYCSLGLSLKYLPNERTEDVKREFEQYIAAVARCDPWLREHPPEIEWGVLGVSFPPFEVPLDHPLVQAPSRAHRRVRGEPTLRGMEAVTDLAWLALAGIPGVLYGPGNPAQAHGSREYVPVGELLAATEAIALLLVDWCGVRTA
jgi:acetylornithine deacetylase